jgi:ergothioneine biosynthesis protein EgtB
MESYLRVRRQTEALCSPLQTEDYVLQSMPDASPARWHLAHTTWFFETFVLVPFLKGYQRHQPTYEYLFNSYYNGVGAQYPRHLRGQLSRPTTAEIRTWRRAVDDAMCSLLQNQRDAAVIDLVTVGINHEQQHQELLVTDIKHALAQNPLWPAYDVALDHAARRVPVASDARIEFDGGVVEIGVCDQGFHFDNEGPAHRALIHPFGLARALVTNADWAAFMQDGGYETHDVWLSDGWAQARAEQWCAPLYWELDPSGEWTTFTTAGRRPVDPGAPVTHISFFEADAYARWAGARLPSEFEWEHAAQRAAHSYGTFQGDGALHPLGNSGADDDGLLNLFGDVWEWTASPYRPYPGYCAPTGAIGEYNGKFMNGCYVLRGGSCATPRDHIRATYRNFFGPDKRWQFTGLRLAYDA